MHGLDPRGPAPDLDQALAFLTNRSQCSLLSMIDQAVAICGSFCIPLEIIAPDGSTRPVVYSATVVIVDGEPAHLFGSMVDIAAPGREPAETWSPAEMIVNLIIANRDLEQLAHLDHLTGIPNRRRFNEVMASEIQKSEHRGLDVSLVMIDIDGFKTYNDNYGHPAGDRALQALSGLLTGLLRRAGDFAARIGGEEFAVVLPATGTSGAIALAERMRRDFANLRITHPANPGGVLTISLGVASLSNSINSVDTLIDAADRMLYRAKRNGRDQIGNLTVVNETSRFHIVRANDNPSG